MNHEQGQAQCILSQPAHSLPYEVVIKEIGSDAENGLNSSEAQRRSEKYGRNDLGNTEPVQPAKMLLRQIANAMTLVRPKFTPWNIHRMTPANMTNRFWPWLWQ